MACFPAARAGEPLLQFHQWIWHAGRDRFFISCSVLFNGCSNQPLDEDEVLRFADRYGPAC